MTTPGDAVLDAIHERRSVGRVRPDPVSRALVEELVTAAVRAPNHRLTAPWRFVVLTGAARTAIDPRLERAPVVIACIARGHAPDRVTARENRDAVAAGIQNMLLAAHARGLGAIWRTGTMPDDGPIRRRLDLDGGEALVGLVYVGWPDPRQPTPKPTPRPPLEEIMHWRER